MLRSVDFVSLDVFTSLQPALDMVAISIGDPGEDAPENLSQFRDYLRLRFLDCDEMAADIHGIPRESLFSFEQLDALISFLRAHQGSPELWRLVVHCRMGSSRSAAVALVVHHLTQCGFPRHQDAHHANGHVLQLASAWLGAIDVPRKMTGSDPHPYLPVYLQI